MRYRFRTTGLLEANYTLKRLCIYSEARFLFPCRLSVACYHHSAQLHRFFTNRFHKKICPTCARPNILPAIACSYCQQQLTDTHIRTIGRDALRELVLARHVNHDQSQDLRARTVLLKKRDGQGASFSFEDLLRGLPQPLAAESRCVAHARRFVELFRSFSFVVATYPFPASLLHLIAIPKASMYDIRQLRRSHIPLLKSMNDKLTSLSSLMLDLLVPMSADRTSNLRPTTTLIDAPGTRLRWSQAGNAVDREPGDATNAADIRQQIQRLLVVGFNYPSEYGQLCMHAIIPPIDNFGIFEPPYFYPLNKILRDLEYCGSAQLFPPAAILR